MIETVILSKKEFKEKFGGERELGMTVREKGKEPVVYFSGRPNIHSRLHEMYHAEKSPMLVEIEQGKKWQTPYELALEELRAEDFTYSSKGRDDIPANALTVVARVMLDAGYKPAVVMGSMKKGLRELGYEDVDRDTQSSLWWWMRDYYEAHRK